MAINKKSLPLNRDTSSHDYPIVAKRTFKLTVDLPENTKNEPFYAIQVNFTGTAAIEVCIISGFDGARVNPVIVPYSGAIVPVCGIGFASSGDDAYGTACTTSSGIIDVIGFGGDIVSTQMSS